jgi:RHS repeat-associated protein
MSLGPVQLCTANLATFDYEYDKDNDSGLFTVLGQRTKSTANVPALSPIATKTELFYDASDQLTRTRTTTTSVGEQSWTYDAIGNRLTQTAGGTTTTYSYVKNGTNPNNSARLATAGANALSHDVNGNVTALGILSYTWDTLDRLKTRNGGPFYTYSFSYDAQNRRTGIDYESTKFIYQGLNVVDMSYRKAGGYFRSNYLFGPGIDEPLARVDSTEVTYYSVDDLGSVILLTDGAGTVKNKYSYGSWGERQTATEPLVQPFRYTGRESAVLDSGVVEKQYYYRARYMVPGMGRFISEDPLQQYVEVIGGNLYNYVGNNPVLFHDPFGLMQDCEQLQIDCFRKCWSGCPPWPIKKGNAGHYKYCQTKCLAAYMTCVAENELEDLADKAKKRFSGSAPTPPMIPIFPPNIPLVPTPRPVIPGLPPFFINPCLMNPSLCDDGSGVA